MKSIIKWLCMNSYKFLNKKNCYFLLLNLALCKNCSHFGNSEPCVILIQKTIFLKMCFLQALVRKLNGESVYRTFRGSFVCVSAFTWHFFYPFQIVFLLFLSVDFGESTTSSWMKFLEWGMTKFMQENIFPSIFLKNLLKFYINC